MSTTNSNNVKKKKRSLATAPAKRSRARKEDTKSITWQDILAKRRECEEEFKLSFKKSKVNERRNDYARRCAVLSRLKREYEAAEIEHEFWTDVNEWDEIM